MNPTITDLVTRGILEARPSPAIDHELVDGYPYIGIGLSK